MGRKTVRFNCHRTLHCCTDVVALPTPWDVLQLVLHTGRPPLEFVEFLTPDEIDEVEEDDPTWLEVNGQKYIMALKRDPTLGCYFLDQTRRECGVYEARPLLCRLYPFKLHETRDGQFEGFSLHKDVGCPRFRDGKVDAEALYEIFCEDRIHQDAYEDLVRLFNGGKCPKSRPEDFIDLFYVERRAAQA
jgi:Fe-S-cluster containining protein